MRPDLYRPLPCGAGEGGPNPRKMLQNVDGKNQVEKRVSKKKKIATKNCRASPARAAERRDVGGRRRRQVAGRAAGEDHWEQGEHALTGSLDGTMRLWEVATGKEVRKFEGHTGGVWGVAVSRDGKRGVTAGGADSRRGRFPWRRSSHGVLFQAR